MRRLQWARQCPWSRPATRVGQRKCQRASVPCVRPFAECTGDAMEIDCDRCGMRGAGCQDCVITMLQPRNVPGVPAADPGYLTEAEVKALGVLAAAGLVPPLRLSLPGDSRPGPAVLPGPRPWAERAFPESKASLCFRDRIRPGA